MTTTQTTRTARPYRAMVERCEYCNTPGCHWSRHAAAVADVRADRAGTLPGWELWKDEPKHIEEEN